MGLNTMRAYYWSLDEAIALIRTVQPFARHAGYHIGLAGGVLNKGVSKNDLDIIVMPMNPSIRSLKGLWRAFELAGVRHISELMSPYDDTHDSRDLYRGFHNDRTIDFFVYERSMAAPERKPTLREALRGLFKRRAA